MKYLALTLTFLIALSSCSAGQAPLRVLFIGNSYVFVNDLPGTFAALAKSGGHPVETGMAAEGGWTLYQHANSTQTLEQLNSSHWDYVVLQEQSQIPSVEQYRVQKMFPAARLLVQQIQQAGARPVFFLTWAHRDGWPEEGLSDYESMQLQINQGYMAIANESHSPVAPVGYAWLTAWLQNPQLSLWQLDGSHPSTAGTYLAACVFYAAIFIENPEGLAYRAHLPADTAKYLQTLAANTVLTDPSAWNLP